MAGSAVSPGQRCHVRSISMPSGSHPLVRRVKEELHTLKSGAAASSSTTTAQTLCDGLRSLGDLHRSIEELLLLPKNQNALSLPQHKKLVEEQLEGSLSLLDLCGAMRDTFVALKEYVQDLRLALRRKGDPSYTASAKKVRKNIKNCLRASKQLDNKHRSRPIFDIDNNLSMVLSALAETREITVSLFRSITSLMSVPVPHDRLRLSMRYFISRALQKRKVACEGEDLDVSFCNLYQSIVNKDDDGARILKAEDCLEAIEVRVHGLETGLQCLFRRLIQNRVSLLNILSL